RTALVATVMAAVYGTPALAFEINTGNQDIQLRWDNTLRYNLAQRVEDIDPKIGNSALFDEGTYSFEKGDWVANRVDILSELDFIYKNNYGFRVSVLFALALTVIGVVLGVISGAIQGFYGGKMDLAFQRFIEIWGAMPELYLLIIFSAVFSPSLALLLILLSLFGWMGLSDYVRAEFLRNRQMDYVRSARALGVSNWHIITRHLLPNSMTPVVTFLPFRMSGAILALTSLDFLGLGVPPGTPSLGELLAQGKNNIDAWWISLATFGVLVVTLLLLTFMGDALRDALDPRKADK
ncbi:MAG: hypothetical protein RJB10_982, partial [Pseudomonadota bacterium]